MNHSIQHDILMDHHWHYNPINQKYSIEFLCFPREVERNDAIEAHFMIRDYFEKHEHTKLKS